MQSTQTVPSRKRLTGHAQDGEKVDEQDFPVLLQAVLRCLITAGLRFPTGPAVSTELLVMMKECVIDGIDIGEAEYEIMVCEPPAPPPPSIVRSLSLSLSGLRRSSPFFVIVHKGETNLQHPKGPLFRLGEYRKTP